jgi:hypothetical protein
MLFLDLIIMIMIKQSKLLRFKKIKIYTFFSPFLLLALCQGRSCDRQTSILD